MEIKIQGIWDIATNYLVPALQEEITGSIKPITEKLIVNHFRHWQFGLPLPPVFIK